MATTFVKAQYDADNRTMVAWTDHDRVELFYVYSQQEHTMTVSIVLTWLNIWKISFTRMRYQKSMMAPMRNGPTLSAMMICRKCCLIPLTVASGRTSAVSLVLIPTTIIMPLESGRLQCQPVTTNRLHNKFMYLSIH